MEKDVIKKILKENRVLLKPKEGIPDCRNVIAFSEYLSNMFGNLPNGNGFNIYDTESFIGGVANKITITYLGRYDFDEEGENYISVDLSCIPADNNLVLYTYINVDGVQENDSSVFDLNREGLDMAKDFIMEKINNY